MFFRWFNLLDAKYQIHVKHLWIPNTFNAIFKFFLNFWTFEILGLKYQYRLTKTPIKKSNKTLQKVIVTETSHYKTI